MATIPPNFLENIGKHLDDLRLQLSAGKDDAENQFESHKEQFRECVRKAQETLEARAPESEEAATKLKQKLDELHLQLALGKMESADAYLDQKDRLEDAINGVRSDLEPLQGKAEDLAREMTGLFEDGARIFTDHLNAFLLNMSKEVVKERTVSEETEDSPGSDVPTDASESGEDSSQSSKEFSDQVEDISAKAREASELVGQKLTEVADDLQSTFIDLKSELEKLIRK